MTYFATKTENSIVKPDLDKVVAARSVADLSLTPTVDALGLPEIATVLEPVDAASGKPSPPTVVRPRFGEEVFVGGAGTVHVSGIGGITGGWVHITVEGGAGDVTVAVASNGQFEADIRSPSVLRS